MGAADVVDYLARMGLRLSLLGENVRVEPKAAITDEVRGLIQRHKVGIVATLQEAANAPEPPADVLALIARVAVVRGWSDEDKAAAVEEWRAAPADIERGLRHLLAFYGNSTDSRDSKEHTN